MPSHDALFKSLLRGFLGEFLRLVVPELAGRLDLASLTFLDKEFFGDGPQSRRLEVDLLVEARFLGGKGRYLLIHVEVEAQARRAMARRLWRYRSLIEAVHDREVLPIVVYLRGGRPGVHVECWGDRLLGPEYGEFRFVALGLSGCRAEEWLEKPEPLAWGLAALMRRGRLSRAEHKMACLRRIAAAPLSEASRFLLANCVETYLELNAEQSVQFAALEAREENRDMREMQMTWADRMEAEAMDRAMEKAMPLAMEQAMPLAMEQAMEQAMEKAMETAMETGSAALRQVLLHLLGQRFGAVSEEVRRQIEKISSLERLTALAERVLEVHSLAELELGPAAAE
jgi:putative YhgA-like transposase/uncharacterized protein DUF4351